MVRIDRNVDIDVTYDKFINGFVKWNETRPEKGTEPDPVIVKLSQGTSTPINFDIFGGNQDLTDLKAYVEARSISFTINGAALNPEPTPDPEPEPTPDEIAAAGFIATAFNTAMQNLIDAFNLDWETEYNAINTTPITFANAPGKPDIKHLRQRAN